MQAVFHKSSDVIDYTPSGAVAAGQVVVVGRLVGVSTRAIGANVLGALTIRGVFRDFVKDASDVAAGDALYWDANGDPVGGTAGSGALTKTSTGNVFAGIALAAAGTTVGTTTVLLCSNDGLAAQTALAVADESAVTFGTATLTRDGNNVIAALPTADPAVAGALWSDSGTVKVSAGT